MTLPPLRSPLDPGSLTLASFRGRSVAVLGLARSGLALTRFLIDQGAIVTAYDARSQEDLADALMGLGDRRPRLLLGPAVDPRDALRGQALICTSPSVSSRFPTTEPRLREALADVEAEGRVPIISEIDLFLRLSPASSVGITGTKGKTTTSALSAAILGGGPAPVLLGGNIGTPLVERLPELTSGHRVVLELSELQLPTLSRGTDVAVYTHVTSDHLDRHGTLEAYRAVKRRLAELVPPGGALVRNDEDPVVRSYAPTPGALLVPYAREGPPPGGIGIAEGWIVADDVPRLGLAGGGLAVTGPGGRVLPIEAIPLPGRHSLSNVCAAVAVGLLHGILPGAIQAAVERFPGVEHRLEHVATVRGVRYVNDSQGTQPDAVMAAVRSFPRPLVLIAGGRSKGLSIDELAGVVAERVSAAVLIGETGPELASAFRAAGLEQVELAASLEAAVARSAALARELLEREAPSPSSPSREGMPAEASATVLLSPAAASFDMFRDFEARGAAFKTAVATLRRDEDLLGDTDA